jgi:hypothetical protein
MKILVDECVDGRLRLLFPGHDCQTARFAGLAGLKNGRLLEAAEATGTRSDFRARFHRKRRRGANPVRTSIRSGIVPSMGSATSERQVSRPSDVVATSRERYRFGPVSEAPTIRIEIRNTKSNCR